MRWENFKRDRSERLRKEGVDLHKYKPVFEEKIKVRLSPSYEHNARLQQLGMGEARRCQAAAMANIGASSSIGGIFG